MGGGGGSVISAVDGPSPGPHSHPGVMYWSGQCDQGQAAAPTIRGLRGGGTQ